MELVYRPLTKAREINRARKAFWKLVTGGSKRIDAIVTTAGGTNRRRLFWRGDLGFWTYRWVDPDKMHYRWVFGVTNPDVKKTLMMTVQFNMPTEGAAMLPAGRFVRDELGRIWLAHSGNIAPGVLGGGRNMFVRLYGLRRGVYQGPLVYWPDGRKRRMILVTALDDTNASQNIALFVADVAAITRKMKRRAARLRREQNGE